MDKTSRLALGLTQPPDQGVLGDITPDVKQLVGGLETAHSP